MAVFCDPCYFRVVAGTDNVGYYGSASAFSTSHVARLGWPPWVYNASSALSSAVLCPGLFFEYSSFLVLSEL